MNSSRLWLLGAVVAVIGIVAAAVGLGVQPALASAAAADASTAQVEQASADSAVRLAQLAKAAAKQSDLQAQNSRYGSAVTGSLRMNTFSQQVRDTAALDGVEVTALSVTNPLVYVPAVAAPAATTASASSSPAPTASATAAPAAAAAAAAASGIFGKTDPRITGANFVIIPVTLTVSGSEAASIAFAQDVQHMSRLFAVDTVTFAKGNEGTAPSTTISGNIYALKN